MLLRWYLEPDKGVFVKTIFCQFSNKNYLKQNLYNFQKYKQAKV